LHPIQIHQNGKVDEEALPRILQRLNETTNRNHPIPLLRRNRKRNLRSYSLPPKIPQPERTQAPPTDAPRDPSQNITSIIPKEDELDSPLSSHSLPQFHTLPKAFTMKEAATTHLAVWTESDTVGEHRNGKHNVSKSVRKRKENDTDATGDWKLDIEEDEIRNLPIDTSVIELHQRVSHYLLFLTHFGSQFNLAIYIFSVLHQILYRC